MDDPDRPDEPAGHLGRRLGRSRSLRSRRASFVLSVYAVDYAVNIAATPYTRQVATETRRPTRPSERIPADPGARPRGRRGARRSRAASRRLSMRKLGQELGVEAMALYRHVRGKDDLLDGVVEVDRRPDRAARPGEAWKARPARQVMAARRVMLRHPWARRVLEERGTAGPTIARLHRADPRDPPRAAASPSTSPTTRCTCSAAGSSASTRTCSRTPAARTLPAQRTRSCAGAMAAQLPAHHRARRRRSATRASSARATTTSSSRSAST